MKKEEIIIMSVYIRENKEVNYNKMAKIIEENKEKPIYIGGDFNARTSTKGGKLEVEDRTELRKSEEKILNEEGKKLIK